MLENKLLLQDPEKAVSKLITAQQVNENATQERNQQLFQVWFGWTNFLPRRCKEMYHNVRKCEAAHRSNARLEITPQLEMNYSLLLKEEAEMEWTAHLTSS